MDAMTVLSKCELCDTPLEFELNGRRFVFNGHSPELCRVGTLERIRNLEAALKSKDEEWRHATTEFARQVDELLVKHRLPTLAERGRMSEVKARLAATGVRLDREFATGIGPGLGEMLWVCGVDPRSIVDQRPGIAGEANAAPPADAAAIAHDDPPRAASPQRRASAWLELCGPAERPGRRPAQAHPGAIGVPPARAAHRVHAVGEAPALPDAGRLGHLLGPRRG